MYIVSSLVGGRGGVGGGGGGGGGIRVKVHSSRPVVMQYLQLSGALNPAH